MSEKGKPVARNASEMQPRLGLHLSGDFGSPAEVLASGLTTSQKRQIFQVWIEDLKQYEDLPEAHRLLVTVREALANLPRETG